ncbi:MAG: hypothetical protein ACRDIU_06280 [Actinomycetota bacterium]
MARKITVWAGLVGWLYSWWLIRGFRAEYAAGDIGPMPMWLTVLMTLASTALIASAVSAGMKAPVWPWLSIVAGIGTVKLVVGGYFAVLRSTVPELSPGPSEAFNAALTSQKMWVVVVFVAAIPTALVLAGLTGLLLTRPADLGAAN